MSFPTLMQSRWSCRAYRPDPLDDDLLAEVLGTAQQTASWCNTQPWGVHLLGSDALAAFAEELTARVAAAPDRLSPDLDLPAAYTGVYRERRREAGFALYESLGIDRADHDRRAEQALLNYSFFGAPHVAVVTADRAQGTYGVLDCGGYVANLMNAALDRGLGSIAQGAIAMYAGDVRDLLGLAEDRVVVCAVALGWPDEEHPVNTFRTARADLDDVVVRVEHAGGVGA